MKTALWTMDLLRKMRKTPAKVNQEAENIRGVGALVERLKVGKNHRP